MTRRKKFSQRKENLVGVKQQPLPRDKRERKIEQLELKMKHFNKERKKVAHDARQQLGYNFDVDYATDTKLKLGDIALKNEKHPQRFSIPMNEGLVDRFIKAPKFVIKQFDSLFDGANHKHQKTQYLLMAPFEEGPVLFEFYNHLKYKHNQYSEDNFNIGFFALLQGKDYLHLKRYDSLSLQTHTQRFDDEGNIVMKYNLSKNCPNLPHSHNYNIRHAVIFSGVDHIGHEDRQVEQKYANYETAVREWKKKLHIVELNKQFSDKLTIGQIYDKLKQFQGNLSFDDICKKITKMTQTENCQKKHGGDGWNLANSQKTSKDQSKQKE